MRRIMWSGVKAQGFDDAVVFLAFERAGGVDQQAARRQHFERVSQQDDLAVVQTPRCRRLEPPLDFRIARERAGARARRVEENAVETRRGTAAAAVPSRRTTSTPSGFSISTRLAWKSQATARTPDSSACAVLLPGAAQRSRKRLAGREIEQRARPIASRYPECESRPARRRRGGSSRESRWTRQKRPRGSGHPPAHGCRFRVRGDWRAR